MDTLRKATPYVPPSTEETRSKVFSKLSAAQELPTTEEIEEGTPPTPKEQHEPKVVTPSQAPIASNTELKNPTPTGETPRIIIKPIKAPPTRGEKNPVIMQPFHTAPKPVETPPSKDLPAPATPDTSIFEENPWDKQKESKSIPDEVRIRSPRVKESETKPAPPAPVEQPVAEVKKIDWKSIRTQGDVLWNYIGQLLQWLQEMVSKADQIKKSVVIERVYTIRNKIEEHFGISFPDMETEKLPNVDILRIAMEYVRYLKENFNPNYFYCPSCKHIVAFYYPVPTLPCPTCGSELEATSPERE